MIYWKMNYDTSDIWSHCLDTTDYSGNGNDFTVVNMDNCGIGRFKECASYNSATDYLACASNHDISFEYSDPFTVSCWIKLNRTGIVRRIFYKLAERPNKGIDIGINIADKVEFVLESSNFTSADIESNKALSADTWYNIICVNSGGMTTATMAIYVNGFNYGSNIQSDDLSGTIINTNPVWVGNGQAGSSYTSDFDGLIDEVIIENVAWSQKKITDYYNYTNGKFARNN